MQGGKGGQGGMGAVGKNAGAPQRKAALKMHSQINVRGDAHERQADHAARSFVAGKGNLAHGLTPAATAVYVLPQSAAQMLPHALRRELEAAFDADFSAIRIHADANAADAARWHHARAFAAGAHVFFGQGEFDPSSGAGRELIAHELAHALQQSGRQGSGQRLVVSDTGAGAGAGAGAVQCAPDVLSLGAAFKNGGLLQPATDTKDCAAAVDRHLESYKGSVPPDVQATADAIKSQIEGKTIDDAIDVIDNLYAAVAPADKNDQLKRMYFDAYKALNAYSDAKTMIGDAPDMTAAGRWDYYTAYLRGDAGWVPALLKTHPVAKNYYPNALVSVAKFDFYGLTRGVLNLDPNLQFLQKMNDALIAAYSYSPLMPNERTASALTAFFLFDIVRKAPFVDLERTLKGEKSLLKRAVLKRKLIKLYIEPGYLSGLVKKVSSDPEVQIIADEVGALLAPIAVRADHYWESISAFTSVVLTNSTDEKALAQATRMRGAIQQQYPQIKEFKGMEARLVKVLELAAKTGGKGKLPTAKQLEANLDAASRAISSLINDLDQSLVRREKKLMVSDIDTQKPADASAQDGDAIGVAAENVTQDMVYGAVLYLLFELQNSLVSYAAPVAEKTSGVAEDAVNPLLAQDRLVARYMHNADMFMKVGQIIGLKTLTEKAIGVYYARQGGLQQSYVGLLTAFELKESSLEDFSKDFPKGEKNTSVFSGANYTEFVFALYYERLLTQLNTALAAKSDAGLVREFDYDASKTPIINTAIDNTNAAFQTPRKYVVPHASTVLYIRPGDEDKVADLLPRDHPMLQALIDSDLKQNDDGFIPRNLSAHQDGFAVWFIPDMDILAGRIAAIPGVVDLLLADGSALGSPSAYDKPRDWLSKLDQAVKLAPEWQEKLQKLVATQMDTAVTALDEPLRRATSNHRRIMLHTIAGFWEMLDKPDVGKKVDTYFQPPRDAINWMERFAREIQPHTEAEQQLQMAALLLELAPLLTRKLGKSYLFGDHVRISGTDRLDIVLPMYSYMLGAADFSSSGKLSGILPTLQPEFPMSELALRTAQLRSLAGEFQSTAQAVQANTVLAGSAGENMLHVPDRGYAVIASKDTERDSSTFIVDGISYQLVQVHNDFSFEPGLVTKPAVMKWNADDLGKSRLWIGDKEVGADDSTPLVTIMRGSGSGLPKQIVITAADRTLLSELTYAVHMNIVLGQLKDLQAVMEVFAEGITTAMQIVFPEAAGPIAYAEIAGSMLQFFSGSEFAQIQAAFDSDSGAFFDGVLDKFKSELTFEALWNYFLFDNVPPVLQPLRVALELAGRMRSMQTRQEPKSQSAAANVFGRIKKAGIVLAKGVDTTKEHISYPVRAAAMFVEGSPILALVVRFIANNMYRLEGLNLKDLGIDKAADAVTQVQQLYLRFEDIIDGLSTYELPEELVPLEAIVEMVGNFVIDHLPWKYRIGLKAAKSVENVNKIFTWIFGVVADELRKASLDPNILWRDYARKEINPYLNQAGKEVADEVHAVLSKVPFLKTLAHMNVNEVTAQFTNTIISPEAEPATAPATTPKLAPGHNALAAKPTLPNSGGARMPRDVMQRAHSGFGHDFSHVRMHRSAAVDSGLRSAHALAATSGSHVYVDRSIALRSGAGRDVVHHELAHVLQQTGGRPLMRRHSSTPVNGRAGVGWRVDHGAESQADRLATQSRGPASGPRPVSAAHGVQPKLFDVVGRFFGELGDPAKLIQHAEKTASLVVNDDALKEAAPGLRDTLGPKLIEAMKTRGKPNSPVAFTAPFDALGDDLVDYVVNNRKQLLLDTMPHLIMAGAESIPKKKLADSKEKPGSFWILKPDKVEIALEEFFFGKTGVSMDVEFNTTKEAGPDGKKRLKINLDNPFKTLKVNYVHLPMVGGDAAIWNKVIENSFGGVAADKLPQYKSQARLALLGKKPGPGLYTTTSGKGGPKKLAFSKSMKALIETYVNPPPDRKVPGDAAPKWNDYIDAKTRPSTGYGQIGLRLGFYNQKDSMEHQKGHDRNSHHTVQFLLLEYLVNSKDRHQPFPNKLTMYPNLTGKGDEVDFIADAPGSSKMISISANEAGRGGTMPTILLSTHAHTYGSVHVAAADDVAPYPPSQGAAIHGTFKDALGPYKSLVMDKPSKGLEAMALKRAGKLVAPSTIPIVGGVEVTDAVLSTAIYNASCKSYTWMRDQMNKKLKRALANEEVEYYKTLVASATDKTIFANEKAQPGYIPSDPSDAVMSGVEAEQKKAFESFGFKEM